MWSQRQRQEAARDVHAVEKPAEVFGVIDTPLDIVIALLELLHRVLRSLAAESTLPKHQAHQAAAQRTIVGPDSWHERDCPV